MTNHGNRRFIKCCSEEKELRAAYEQEYENYNVAAINQCPYIRSRLDLIGHDSETMEESQPKCVVFERMDTDLWQLPSENFRSGSQLPRVVAHSVLKALTLLHEIGGIHTDVSYLHPFS